MYKAFFGLKANPFSVNPDPQYLLETPPIQEALTCLAYGIRARRGFVLLTGEVGTGKTTLVYKLLEWLQSKNISTALVFNSRLDETQFFNFVLADFGLKCDLTPKYQVLRQLQQFLLERYHAGQTAVLIVDEAQNLSLEVLEEIRLLTNLETATEKLLQVVLVGQPELEQKLRNPKLRALRQRITLWAKTMPLTPAETRSYVGQRLRLAGADGKPVFAPDAVDALHRYSHGIPRVINVLSEHALLRAFAHHEDPVSLQTVGAAAHEFELDHIDERNEIDGAILEADIPANVSGSSWERLFPFLPPLIEVDNLGLKDILDLSVKAAQQATQATGAAIALVQGNLMACSARSGTTAPEIGVPLDAENGLTGECLRSGKVLHCFDAEFDWRVNREACRTLGIRSVLVAPIVYDSHVHGLVEVLSPSSHAFDQYHVSCVVLLADVVARALLRTQENSWTETTDVVGIKNNRAPTPLTDFRQFAASEARELQVWPPLDPTAEEPFSDCRARTETDGEAAGVRGSIDEKSTAPSEESYTGILSKAGGASKLCSAAAAPPTVASNVTVDLSPPLEQSTGSRHHIAGKVRLGLLHLLKGRGTRYPKRKF